MGSVVLQAPPLKGDIISVLVAVLAKVAVLVFLESDDRAAPCVVVVHEVVVRVALLARTTSRGDMGIQTRRARFLKHLVLSVLLR